MLRNLIVFNAKPAILGLILIFVILKALMIYLHGVKGHFLRTFFMSLSILGRGVIDNTFYENLQKYYRVSNKINKFFYVVIILLGVLYYVFKFYMPAR